MNAEQAVAAACRYWETGQPAQAEYLCRHVLQQWPDHGGALHLMGLLAFAAGDRPLAIAHIRRACASPSAPAPYHSDLAELLRQDGKLSDAEAAARRALALDSALTAGWTNLGIILQEQGKFAESLDYLQRAVTANPDSPQSHNNLGNTFTRVGRLGEARREYQSALSLEPAYAEAHNNLAYLLNALGDTGAAMAEINRAIEANPQYADAYVTAAVIALAMGAPEEALRWLDHLAGFAPHHHRGLVTRARAFLECGSPKEALESARRAVASAPESGDAVEILALALSAVGQVEDALATIVPAASLRCSMPENAFISKSALLSEVGRSTEALEALDKALAINPNSARALFTRAMEKDHTSGDPGIERMEQLLVSGDLAARDDVVMLHFALGKAWLDVGDDSRAFQHLAEGNRLKRATFAYDAAATSRWMESISKTFTVETMKRFAAAGDPSDVPVFVVGLPRSGTTLIEQILASHPKVFGAGELKTMQKMAGRTSKRDFCAAGFPQWIDAMTPRDAAEFGHTYLEQLLPLAPGAARIVDKMPANFLYVGLIRAVLPNARIIHCRRDAVDTCLSCYSKLFASEQKFAYDLAELGQFYRAYAALMEHWRALLPADRFIEVQYEEVVDDLEGQARRMVAFLGLAWSDACLEYYRNPRPVRTASFAAVRRPIYRSSVGRWTSYARHLGPLLDTLGVCAT